MRYDPNCEGQIDDEPEEREMGRRSLSEVDGILNSSDQEFSGVEIDANCDTYWYCHPSFFHFHIKTKFCFFRKLTFFVAVFINKSFSKASVSCC